MFNGAQDFTISGGNFSNVGHDLIIHEGGQIGLLTLHRHTSLSASYDAEARCPPPLCHPNTRKAVLRDLEHWANSTADVGDAKIIWLYGPAGAGKTAIAQTFAQTCAQSGTLIGSFFFWRSDSSRNNPQRLFTTIALQMAIAIRPLRGIVDETVIDNPFAPTSSIENQCKVLIIQPWLSLKDQTRSELERGETGKKRSRYSSTTSAPNKRLRTSDDGRSVRPDSPKQPPSLSARILIIDGLDECSNEGNEWERILSTLAEMVQKFSLPIRILICSRPEPRIKECFGESKFSDICRWMPLDSTYEASRDIRVFLIDGFRKILLRHSHSMVHVSRPWPASVQVEYLVRKASGQFIYASTVLKYIGEDGDVPADRLKVILGLPVQDFGPRNSPYAELDALYLQILSTVKNRPLFLRVLAARIALFQDISKPGLLLGTSTSFIRLLDIPLGTVHAAFHGVHSLFRGPSPVDSGFAFCHASFLDFLLSQERSSHFYIDKSLGHDFLAQCCLKQYDNSLSLSFYPREHWAYHSSQASGSDELISCLDSFEIYPAITQQVKETSRGQEWPSVLATFITLIYNIWARLRKKSGQQLQHLRNMSTVGFTLVVYDRSEHARQKRYTSCIRYPPDLASAVPEETSTSFKFEKLLMDHLVSEVIRMTPYSVWKWVGFHEICPLT